MVIPAHGMNVDFIADPQAQGSSTGAARAMSARRANADAISGHRPHCESLWLMFIYRVSIEYSADTSS